MRLVVGLLAGAAAGAATATLLRTRGRDPDPAPPPSPATGADPEGPSRVAVDVSDAPADPT